MSRSDLALDRISAKGVLIVLWAFLELYRKSKFTQTGELIGEHGKPLAGVNVREATLSLAKMFSNSFRQSSFHDKGEYARELK